MDPFPMRSSRCDRRKSVKGYNYFDAITLRWLHETRTYLLLGVSSVLLCVVFENNTAMTGVSANRGAIVFAAFMTKFIGTNLSFVAGVYHISLVEEYGNVTLVTLLGSLFTGIFALSGPLGSFVINTTDCRFCVILSGICGMLGFGASFFIRDIKLLFLSYGLMAGLGTGFAQSGSMVIIGYYFPEKSSLVSGICTCGSGLGVFLFPILIRYLLDNYGLRGAFLLNGGVMLNVCVCGMLMRPSKFERERKKTGNISPRDLKQVFKQFPDVLSNVSFLLFAFCTLSLAMSISTLYLYLPDYFYTQGASLFESSFAISTSGIGSMISRIFVGLAANDKSIGPEIFYSCLPSLLGMITLFLPIFIRTAAGRIAYGFLAGLYSGACWAIQVPIVLKILGVKHFASGFGIVSWFLGVGILTGPPIAGVIFKSSGHYYSVFLFSAGTFFLATALAFCSTLSRRTSSVEDLQQESQKETNETVLEPLAHNPESRNPETRLETE